MDELVSVIIPVYKVEQHLDRCMKSVTNQTYNNLEIILVDDGSPDNSPQLCEQWKEKDHRVTVLHKKNGGLSSARNEGLMTVHGEYVCFVDSDDWISSNYVSKLYELLKSYEADVAFCEFVQTKKIKEIDDKNPKVKILNQDLLMRYFFRVDGERSSYAVWRGLYKKELIQDIKFIEGIITEDVPFIYEVYKRTDKAVFTSERLYYYFVNNTGITSSPLSAKDLVLFDIWDGILKDVPQNYYKWAKINRNRVPFTLYVKGLFRGIDDYFDKEILNSWKKEIKENYKELMSSGILEWKRKLVLFYIAHFK